jgi:hypothetical protein
MKAPRPKKVKPEDQLDFWPELATKAMVNCARLFGACAPARSVEDGRASAKRGGRLGNPALNADSFCPSEVKGGGRD